MNTMQITSRHIQSILNIKLFEIEEWPLCTFYSCKININYVNISEPASMLFFKFIQNVKMLLFRTVYVHFICLLDSSYLWDWSFAEKVFYVANNIIIYIWNALLVLVPGLNNKWFCHKQYRALLIKYIPYICLNTIKYLIISIIFLIFCLLSYLLFM